MENLVKVHKVKVKRFPDKVLKDLQKVSNQVVSDIAKKDKMAAKVYKSMEKFRGQVLSWQKVAEIGYAVARGF